MTRVLEAAAGFVWFLGVAVAIGGVAVVRGGADASELAGWRRRLAGQVLAGLAVAVAAGLVLLATKSADLADLAGGVGRALPAVLGESRFGAVWLAGQGALLAAAAPGLLAGRRLLDSVPGRAWTAALAAAALVSLPFASHSAGAEWMEWAIGLHAVHLVSLAIWLGGLAALGPLLRDASGEPAVRPAALRVLAGFSRRAPYLVAAALASGVALAVEHVGGWPALLATPYGAVVLAKVALVPVALGLAAALRWRSLPALAGGEPAAWPAAARRLAAEAGVAAAIVLLAAALAQTVPGAHDEIEWWLPFRFSIRATWPYPWVPERAIGGLVVAFLGASLAAGSLRRGRVRFALGVVAVAAVAAAALALPALAVQAYPGTYWRPTVAYDAVSVARGRSLYAEHCTGCHGVAGRGDGPLARELPKPPANLTEPHTAEHTAGDMFWWLTHGIPDSGMPPMADVLEPEDRWDLVNYLRAFSAGYEARLLGRRVAPGAPWLAGIDFDYRTAAGESGRLSDFRGEACVLLVLFTPGASDVRLGEIRAALPALEGAGGRVLAVPSSGRADRAAAERLAPVPVVVQGAEAIAESWHLIRRTFADPGNAADDDRPAHLEFLVDRFGYVRARWRADDPDGLPPADRVAAEIESLAREPRILPPPDEHVH